MQARTVILLAGGFSPERYVSLASAANIAAQLRHAGHRAAIVDISVGELSPAEEARCSEGPIRDAPTAAELDELARKTDILALLQSPLLRRADVIFPIIHGAFGEDGRLQALLEVARLSYVGSDYVGQALAMNKHLAKELFVQNQIPTAPWVRLTPGEPPPAGLCFPQVIKPANAGSSLGITICHGRAEMAEALGRAFAYDREAVVERFIAGREFTIGVLGDRVLAAGEIRAGGSFDYEAKYRAAQTQEIFPADLPAQTVERVGTIARGVVAALRLRHYCRIDFIVNEANEIFVLEANAAPGMTKKSLYPQSAAAAGLAFQDVCVELCEMALRDRA